MPLLRTLDSKYEEDLIASQKAPKICDFLSSSSKLKFDNLIKILQENFVDHSVDYKMVRGLDYYNDVCYEFKIKHNDLGPSQNTLIGGGRYDSLSSILGGRQIVPASGWAAGINRIIEVISIPEFHIQDKIDIVLALVFFIKI